MYVKIGNDDLEMGGPYLTELRSSNEIQDDLDALRKRMEEDGYILLRGFHDREQVLQARLEITQRLQQLGRLAPGTDPEEAVLGPDNKGASLMGAIFNYVPINGFSYDAHNISSTSFHRPLAFFALNEAIVCPVLMPQRIPDCFIRC